MQNPPQDTPCVSPEIARRRTFAIISHPDAGKTTLTEQFLLHGGAIRMAGQVRAKGNARRTRSDFMKVEKERGVSVSASAMSFDYDNFRFNLVDTPGHADFSEDTYRTLTAVDAAIMVIDGARGVESQTRKLFEICRLRDMPILTFCNKMDRDARDTFEIIEEIQDSLAIDVVPANWPIGSGRDFKGCYDLATDRVEIMERTPRDVAARPTGSFALDDPELAGILLDEQVSALGEEVEMARALLPSMDREAFLEGNLTPIWFGSALYSHGVRELMDGIGTLAPAPGDRSAVQRRVASHEPEVSGFVFKVQANMDPRHRDRVAFLRLCSGHFRRGMKLVHVRTKKPVSIASPVLFLASDRTLTEEAWAGDIIGIPNHGQLRIGDSLAEREPLRFTGIPTFAPEILRTVMVNDPLMSKHLEKALTQFAEEGAAKLFRPRVGVHWIVGVVGELQFDVLASRLQEEYRIPVRFESTQFISARWMEGPAELVEAFGNKNPSLMAVDHDGDVVYLVRLAWDIDRVRRDYPELSLSSTKETLRPN